MNYFTKRLMSVTLAALMAGSAIPATAFAVDVSVSDSVEASAVQEPVAPVTADVTANANLVYTGAEQSLVKNNTAKTFAYAVVPGNTYAAPKYSVDTYKAEAKATVAGEYNVYYTDTRTTPENTQYVKVTVKQASPVVTPKNTTVAYDGKVHQIDADITLLGNDKYNEVYDHSKTVFNYVKLDAQGAESTTTTNPTDVGVYKLKSVTFKKSLAPSYESKISSNYAGTDTQAYEVPVTANVTLTIGSPMIQKVELGDKTITVDAAKELAKLGSSQPAVTTVIDGKEYTKANADTFFGNTGNKITYTYTDANGVTSTVVPSKAGKYSVVATITDGTNYQKVQSNVATLTVIDKQATDSVTLNVDKYGYKYTGKSVAVSASAMIDGEKYIGTIQYRYKGADGVWHDGLPTNVGNYTVYAYVIKGGKEIKSDEKSVVINKAFVTLVGFDGTISYPTTYYYTGKTVEGYKATANAGDNNAKSDLSSKLSFSYKVVNDKNELSVAHEGLPSATGKYEITVKFPVDSNYELTPNSPSTTTTPDGKYYTFTNYVQIKTGGYVKFKSVPTNKSGEDLNTITSTTAKKVYQVEYTGKPIDFVVPAKAVAMDSYTFANNGNILSDVKYEYKKADAPEAAANYTAGLPTDKGTYTIRAYVDTAEGYTGASTSFTVKVGTGAATITLPANKLYAYTGKTVDYVAATDYAGTIAYQYQKQGTSTWTDGLPTTVGTYNIKISLPKTADFDGKTMTDTITIVKGTPVITLADQTVEFTGSPIAATVASTIGTPVVTYKAADAAEFTSTAPTAVGTYTVKAVVAATENNKAAEKTATLTIKEAPAVALKSVTVDPDKFVYVYKTDVAPAITVTDANDKTVDPANYTVTVDNKRLVGKHTVTVVADGKKYTGTVTADFTINPKSTSITSIKAGRKSATVKFAKVKNQISGYQIQYSRKADFSNATTVKASKSVTSKTLTKLSSGKKYYVRVRVYKNAGGMKYNSAWSAAKTVKAK